MGFKSGRLVLNGLIGFKTGGRLKTGQVLNWAVIYICNYVCIVCVYMCVCVYVCKLETTIGLRHHCGLANQ